MTIKQHKLYIGEWSKVAKTTQCATNEYRYELHEKAHAPRSSKDFTNADLDRVLGVFRAISQPANLAMQMRQQSQPATRLIWKIKRLAPEAYWRHIAEAKFGAADLDELTEAQLKQLVITLSSRARNKSSSRGNETLTEAPTERLPELCNADADPF